MNNLNIVILDSATLGDDIEFSLFEKFGTVNVYARTSAEEVSARIKDCDIIIVNKIKLDEKVLGGAKKLKLICVTATGFDNIDLEYCRNNNIAVCNVRGYSTDSVAQVTASMALALVNHIPQYAECVRDGSYTERGVQNRLTPVFHELNGMTWGVVGLGAIGARVAEIAKVFGCKVLAFKRQSDPRYNCVSLEELCRESDIISVHLPLSESTYGLLNEKMISLMKKTAIVINVARGAVVNELALANAILEKRIGGLGIDVYSKEPMEKNSPYVKISDKPNVILTPHMAWGAYEARVRCMEEIAMNIEAFFNGEKRNRVEG